MQSTVKHVAVTSRRLASHKAGQISFQQHTTAQAEPHCLACWLTAAKKIDSNSPLPPQLTRTSTWQQYVIPAT
jgi:hypothetical protein